MGSKSSIEWTDATWTPIRVRSAAGERVGWGCEKVSDGCKNCYAETLNKRLGTGLPYAVGAVTKAGGEYFLDEKMLTAPLRWRKPRRVFVCSMTDLFGEWVPDEWIDRMFAVMALTPQHTYQVLTKRPERMREYISGDDWGYESRADAIGEAMEAMSGRPVSGDPSDDSYDALPWPLPNVWLGTSVEDQPAADKRIPELLATPAAVRFVSYEPALGPVDFATYKVETGLWKFDKWAIPAGLHWVIVGGESGPAARPFDIAWARRAVAQCKAAGVACFVKQLGAKPFEVLHEMRAPGPGAPVGMIGRTVPVEVPLKLKNLKGGDMSEWPEDLRVREMPIRGAVSRD